MSTAPRPDFWLNWRLPTAPDAEDVYDFAMMPLADEDSFKEPRLRSIGVIRRRASSEDGDSQAPSVDVEIDDSDGVIRAILATNDTRHAIGGEAGIVISSETARKAGGSGADIMRGRVADLQAPSGRLATMRIAGVVGDTFTGINLDKTIPNVRIGSEHRNAPEASVGLVYPLVIGEHSDVGATDANGVSVEKGILPAIDVGDVLLLDDGTEIDTDVYPIAYLSAPSNLQATVQGTPGTRSITYAVTALSDYGETTAATVTVTTAPTLLNATDRVLLEWDTSVGAVGYRVYRNGKRITVLNNGGTWSDPEETYTDTGIEAGGGVPPVSNSATIAVETDDGTAYPWTRFVAAGKSVHVEYVYASDLAENGAPKRTRLGASEFENELLIYGEAGYPHDDPYVDMVHPDGTIIRQTVFYMRGPRVTHHRNKTVTVAWNGWGVEDVGDGRGDAIIQFFPGLLWLLNEEVLKDDGLGYRTGDYGPLETFANGIAKLKSSRFVEAQQVSARFLDNEIGYLMSLAITEPTTMRQVIRRAHQTAGSHDATNRFGQWYPFLVDDTALAYDTSNGLSPLQDEATMSGNLGDETSSSAAPTGAYELLGEHHRAYRDKENVIRWIPQDIKYDGTITRVTYDGSWDADAQRFRLTDHTIEYDYARYGHKEPKQKSKRQGYYSHDEATLADANDRYLRRHLVPQRPVAFATDLGGLDDEIGVELLLTHYEGAGGADGDEDTRILLMGQDVDPMGSVETVLHALVLDRVVVNGLSPLQNETTMTTNLGDETSSAYPPVGAWELM
jgi:hypothetical protein